MDRRARLQEEIDGELLRGADITREIRRTTAETKDMCNDTARAVHSQGEQLNRAERKLDGIDADLKESHHHLREVESVWYSWLPKSVKKKFYSRPETSSAGDSSKKASSAPQKTAVTGASSRNDKQRYVPRTVGHPLEDQMNDDLECVDEMLDDIMHSACATGRELDQQNVQLNRMIKKTDRADNDLAGLNIRMGREIRK